VNPSNQILITIYTPQPSSEIGQSHLRSQKSKQDVMPRSQNKCILMPYSLELISQNQPAIQQYLSHNKSTSVSASASASASAVFTTSQTGATESKSTGAVWNLGTMCGLLKPIETGQNWHLAVGMHVLCPGTYSTSKCSGCSRTMFGSISLDESNIDW
jgi:hypothetical protein